MPKIVIVGAGSGFGSRLSLDVLACPSLQHVTIGLCDIHAERLEAVRRYVQSAIDAHRLPAQVVASTERCELLEGADFVITSISVGGDAYAGWPYNAEINIPAKYGVDQSVGDTLGPGGVFRFLRTGPVQLAICRDIERYCPSALLLNYTNPMCMLTWLHSVASRVRNVGLCHSVQWTAHELAGYLGVPETELDYRVAGINHQAWFLRLEHHGKDLYPALRKAMLNSEIYAKDTVRFEMLRYFGYFVTESTPHNSEYLPYFRRTPELRAQFGLQSRIVPDRPSQTREWMQQTGGDSSKAPKLRRSKEYASGIIEASVTDTPLTFNGNVMNNGYISNLPQDCCVEVPCQVDHNGVRPSLVGALPSQCAAWNRTNTSVHELAVRAVLERDREAAFHAVALDPLTASVLPLGRIREMFEEMWAAERPLLTHFD